MPTVRQSGWEGLDPFTATIDGSDHVLCVAMTGGAKSTLVGSLLLDVPSLVIVDDKGGMIFPGTRTVELPYSGSVTPGEYDRQLRRALAWSDQPHGNRIILRPDVEDLENRTAHNAIFRVLYHRGHAIIWVDEITGTGATPAVQPSFLRGISARGRTRGLGLWACTQAPFGLTPGLLRRNARYTIFGPLDPDDVAMIHRPGIDIAANLPTHTGRFIVYTAGEREPRRLYVPIPPGLRRWRAP